jgi:transcription initiation factor TFIIIB Brf1 subunit/transcription initiation factor TFIIB
MLYRQWQWNTEPHSEKAIKKRFENIDSKCKLFSINSTVIELAKKIYFDINKEIETEDNFKTRGASNEGLQAAALYYAFKQCDEPRTHKEIAHIFNIDCKYVSNGIKRFNIIFDKKKTVINDIDLNINYDTKIDEYHNYINKYSKLLDFNEDLINQLYTIISDVVKHKILDNNTPMAIIAGILFYVATMNGLDNICKNTLEKQCNISAPTIVKICDKLLNHYYKQN